MKNHNHVPNVLNCPLLMVKDNDRYFVYLCTNPSKKFSYLSDVIQLTNYDGKGATRNVSLSSTNSSGEFVTESNNLVRGLNASSLLTQKVTEDHRMSLAGGPKAFQLLTQKVTEDHRMSLAGGPKAFQLLTQKVTEDHRMSLGYSWIPSKVRFLNIYYTNPNMSNEILLEIPHTMFYVGNQLLSATFVLRMLEYTVGSGVSFDMDYKLKIMDSNIQYFEMDSNEYLELELDTYNIKRILLR